MISPGNRRQASPMYVMPDSSAGKLARVPLTEGRIQEGWLQRLIHNTPDILPIEEIEPVFAPPVSLGMELQTNVGPVDNILISPSGYITIVETKLWRNPEARREVVGQIIDYAKEVARWSYDDLDARVRAFSEHNQGARLGIIETLEAAELIVEEDESVIVDTITRNLQLGRFLLLIVGDGIRESVENIAEFLNQTPLLQFTFALLELKLFEYDVNGTKPLIVIPEVVARTKEIPRLVVEAREIRSVTLRSEASSREKSRSGKLTQEAFFDALEKNPAISSEDIVLARRIIGDTEKLGCVIDWAKDSFVVKLADPGGSGKLLMLFPVYRNGSVTMWYSGDGKSWLSGQLRSLGVSEAKQIAYDLITQAYAAFGLKPKADMEESFPQQVQLSQLHSKYDEFLHVIEQTVNRIRDAVGRIET